MVNGKDNNITRAAELGQAVWLDQISRDMLDGGEIQGLADAGIRGITTNPTIFDGAIAGSDVYDDRLAEYAKDGVLQRLFSSELRLRTFEMPPTFFCRLMKRCNIATDSCR